MRWTRPRTHLKPTPPSGRRRRPDPVDAVSSPIRTESFPLRTAAETAALFARLATRPPPGTPPPADPSEVIIAALKAFEGPVGKRVRPPPVEDAPSPPPPRVAARMEDVAALQRELKGRRGC